MPATALHFALVEDVVCTLLASRARASHLGADCAKLVCVYAYGFETYLQMFTYYPTRVRLVSGAPQIVDVRCSNLHFVVA